ncbi:MAG TPA: hypothetical protein VJH03_18070 [Blastocatellia bacterium]|nr:hypothetical protein [Blastocatellia bacterium]
MVGKIGVSASLARARVNRFLLSEVGSQFCAGDPELDVAGENWRVPILLVTPGLVVGRVGEASVDSSTRELADHTEVSNIYASAEKLRKRRIAAIKSAFLRAREG